MRIPKHKSITNARILVDCRQQKEDPYRVCIILGGNLIIYKGPFTTTTVAFITLNVLLNSLLSTEGAKYCISEIEDFYLCTL